MSLEPFLTASSETIAWRQSRAPEWLPALAGSMEEVHKGFNTQWSHCDLAKKMHHPKLDTRLCRHLHASPNVLLGDMEKRLRPYPILVNKQGFYCLSKTSVYFSSVSSELIAWSWGSEGGWRRQWKQQCFPVKRHWCPSKPVTALWVGFLTMVRNDWKNKALRL